MSRTWEITLSGLLGCDSQVSLRMSSGLRTGLRRPIRMGRSPLTLGELLCRQRVDMGAARPSSCLHCLRLSLASISAYG